MAERIISTRLRLEGESEYNAAIKNIGASSAELKSQLALLASQFEGQLNSYDYLTKKGEILAQQYNNQALKVGTLKTALEEARTTQEKFANAIAEQEAKIAASRQELEKLASSSGDTSEEQKKLTEAIAAQEKELVTLNDGYAKAGNAVTHWSKEVNYGEKGLNGLNSEVKKNSAYMDEAANNSNKMATSIDGYGKQVKQAADDTDKSSAAIKSLASALAAAGIAKTIKEIAEALTEAVKASVEFESAFAGVTKTVEGTPEQLQAISDGIKELSTVIPASTTELAKIAETAGQLGIATDDVLEFTKVMTNLGVTTNLSATEAATAIARFANIAGTTSADYEKLGSAIVALGNDSAATEKEITQMATNLAAAGTLAGLAEPQILALAAAMSSVGIEAQAGGTAMTQTLTAMEKAVAKGGDGLDRFAKVAGMSADEFSHAWKTDALSAVQAFISGLGKLESQGESATLILDEMGLSGIRQSDMLKRLGLASEELAASIDTSSAAWEENVALANEAALRYETTESKFQLFKNSVDLLEIAIGDALTPALGELAETGADAFQWAADFISENPEVVSAVTALTVALTVLVGGITAVALAANVLVPAMQTLMITLAFNPVVLLATALAALVAGLVVFAATMPKATSEAKEFAERTEASRQAYAEFKAELVSGSADTASLAATYKKLAETSDGSTASMAAMSNVARELVAQFPELSEHVDENTGALTENWEAALKSAEATEIKVGQITREAEVLSDLETAKGKRAAAEAELQALEEKGVTLTRNRLEASYAYGLALSEEEQRIFDLGNEITKYDAVIEALGDDLHEARDGMDAFNRAAEAQKDALDPAQESIESIISELGSLKAEYEAAYDAAYASISNQIGLWDEMDNTVTTSADTLNNALLSQIEYLDNYSSNLDNLLGRNISGVEEFAKNFSDGSAESAAALAGLANASDAEIIEIINNMKRVEEGKEAWSEQTAAIATDFDARMSEITGRLNQAVDEFNHSDAMYKSGANNVQGFIDGMEEKRADAIAKAISIATDVNNAWRNTHEEHSPSKVTERSGSNWGQGFIVGMEGKRGEMVESARESARQVIEAFSGEFKDYKAALDFALDVGAITGREHTSLLQEAIGAYNLAETDVAAYQDILKKLASETTDTYKTMREDIQYLRDMGVISEAEYYDELTRLRDEYLDESSSEWRRVNVEIYNHQQALLKEYESQLKEALKEIEKQWDAWLKARKAQIKEELALEKSRIQGIVDGINAEIKARRELRADESSEDKIAAAEEKVAAAEKTLAVARAQAEYARDENERVEAEKEVVRKEQALAAAETGLAKAKQDYEDQLWYREKEAEIKAVQSQVAVAEAAAAQKSADAEVYAAAQLSKAQAEATAAAQKSAQAAQESAQGLISVADRISMTEKALSSLGDVVASVADRFRLDAETVKQTITKSAVANVTYTTAAATSGQIANVLHKLLDMM